MQKSILISLCFSFLFVLFLTSCEDKKSEGENYSCISITDENGEPLGKYGNCDLSEQWSMNNLTNDELALFQTSDTITENLSAALTLKKITSFPNPATVDDAFIFFLSLEGSGDAKLKLAITDGTETLIRNNLRIREGSNSIYLATNRSLGFRSGNFYRLYYQILGNSDSVIAEGYGNFLICQSRPVVNIDLDCL